MPPAFAPDGCKNRAEVMFCPVFFMPCRNVFNGKGGRLRQMPLEAEKRGGRPGASCRMNIKADMLFHGTALLHAALVVCASFVWAVSAVPADFLPMRKNAGRTAGGGRFPDVGGLRP